ncbi:MAG: hypothetical protein IJN80_08040 [Clostridia bacterium]|nr:hypothetical protein [Clostridia bacterium]
MKRILAILLCVALMAVVPACKPDNIQYPSEIIDPEEQEILSPDLKEEEEQTPQDPPSDENSSEEQKPSQQEEPSQEEDSAPEAEEPIAPLNPLAADGFSPSADTASALQASGLIKKSSELSVLKNRTISFYTADDTPAFFYTDSKGKRLSEWDWMKAYADESSFLVEYSIKPAAVSAKAQRVALFAGKKLSLIQLHSSDLAAGLTLTRPATAYLDLENQSFGISKTVLAQSANRLFAPIGNVDSLWYNKALVGESDPATLQQQGKWTVAAFQSLATANAENKILPLQMESALPWATLSGKSPITLKEGRLDTNINSEGSKSVWAALQKMNQEIPTFLKDEDLGYSLKDGTVFMQYTTLPEKAEEMTLGYAPLPALSEESGSTVTFSGTFFALPKYEDGESAALAALTFAESWCNRYTEARAAQLQPFGIQGAEYQKYADLAEQKGMLILGSKPIEEMVETYLKGITDESINMANAYGNVITKLYAYVATQNLYY